jgi:hypothetical protein
MTPARLKTRVPSLGEVKYGIRRSELPRGDVRESRRVARVAHRRGASMSLAHWIFTFPNIEMETQDATRRIAAAGPIPPNTPQETRPHSTVRRFSAAWWSGALRRSRPRSGARGVLLLRQQQWHSPHCETLTLGRANAPTTGRVERSGSR